MVTDDHEIAFSYEQFEDVVKLFATSMPEFFLRHPVTASLAMELQRLRLRETKERRFTVAVMGQMKAGKSTLLNALIGRDLAPVGVVETTATLNYFRYGTGTRCEKFRVNWKDGHDEDIDLTRINDWTGTSPLAKKTRSLDFFVAADFLMEANILDTPGAGSVIETHTEALKIFEREGFPDAVLYAIRPIAKATDAKTLSWFGRETRLPGARAYNGIAVVLQWESRPSEIPFEHWDPYAEAVDKCNRIQQQIGQHVADVFPASGLLARYTAEVPVAIWQKIADIGTKCAPAAMSRILMSERHFKAESIGDAVMIDATHRQEITANIEWELIPMCIRIAMQYRLADGLALSRKLREMSGIDHLLEALKKRFFKRADLIKASTTLRKAWGPCDIAREKLKQELNQQRALLKEGQDAFAYVADYATREAHLLPIHDYIEKSLVTLQRDADTLDSILGSIEPLEESVTQAFRLFDGDIDGLKLLENQRESFSADDAYELECLFAQRGSDVRSRLRLPPEQPVVLQDVKERLRYWSAKRRDRNGDQASICLHACDVLKRLLRHLEATT